jgi:hypothetical protein
MTVSKKHTDSLAFPPTFAVSSSMLSFQGEKSSTVEECAAKKKYPNAVTIDISIRVSLCFLLEEMELEIIPHQKEKLTHIDAALTVDL